MAVYMKYGKIKGDVTTKQFEHWIALHSFQWGVGRHIDSQHGVGQSRQGNHASVSEIVVTKVLDPASLHILTDIFKGKLETEVDIHFTHTDAANHAYLKIKLWETGISGYSVSTSGDRPHESLTLNFTKISVTDIKVSPDGKTKTPETITYDLAKMMMS